MRILEVAPDEFGFRQYVLDLVHAAQNGEFLEPIFIAPLSGNQAVRELVRKIRSANPELVHIHHEFTYFGSKLPWRYRFPELMRRLRRALPSSRFVATAHTVISRDFRYPTANRGWQTPVRALANAALLPFVRPLWIQKTWGVLDGTIAHSELQLPVLRGSGCPRAWCIPHYVPNRYDQEAEKKLAVLESIPAGAPILYVFGYFTPEKAQDVVIEAMGRLQSEAYLVLAGGVRREEDRGYFEHCLALREKSPAKDRVLITGFISWPELDDLSRRAALAIVPFRETSGSGSLADLFSRGQAVLASDLPLNCDISRRVSGAIAYFRSEDPEDCARQIDQLLKSPEALRALRNGASAYRERYSPENILKEHLKFFREVTENR